MDPIPALSWQVLARRVPMHTAACKSIVGRIRDGFTPGRAIVAHFLGSLHGCRMCVGLVVVLWGLGGFGFWWALPTLLGSLLGLGCWFGVSDYGPLGLIRPTGRSLVLGGFVEWVWCWWALPTLQRCCLVWGVGLRPFGPHSTYGSVVGFGCLVGLVGRVWNWWALPTLQGWLVCRVGIAHHGVGCRSD